MERLDKLIASRGTLSRKDAQKQIRSGAVTVNGAVCRQILARRGVTVGGHIYAIGNIFDIPFDPVEVTAEHLNGLQRSFFALN